MTNDENKTLNDRILALMITCRRFNSLMQLFVITEIVKKYVFRSYKIKFFSWSTIDFILNILDKLIGEIIKRLFFRDILSDKFIGIFVQTSFPRGIRMRKEELSFKFSSHFLVLEELRTVIRGDGMHVIDERQQERKDGSAARFNGNFKKLYQLYYKEYQKIN
jgi:hypothetical protein